MGHIVHHPSPGAIGQAVSIMSEKSYPRRRPWMEGQPGMRRQIEFCFSFLAWVQALRAPLTVDALVQRWGMSRATAFRYLAAYRAARGEA